MGQLTKRKRRNRIWGCYGLMNHRKTRLLPALPGQWSKGSITGLTLCGGARLSMAWENGRLTDCGIWSPKPMELTVIYGEEERLVTLQTGKTANLKF